MRVEKFGRMLNIVEWAGQTLEKYIAIDTETRLIQGPSDTPNLVITTVYDGSQNIYWVKNERVKEFLETLSNNVLIFHNAAFDISVFETHIGFNFHDHLMKNQVFDTALLYKLVKIAEQGFEPKRWALDLLIKEFLNEELEKNDEIRLTFGQYLNPDNSVNYAQISPAHLKYASLDVVATLIIYQILMKKMEQVPTQTNSAHQIHLLGDIALYQITKNGIGVDVPYTTEIRNKFHTKMERAAEVMAIYGLTRGKGFQTAYEGVVKHLGIKGLPVTDKGKLSHAEEDLQPFSHIPFIKALLDFKEVEKQYNFLTLLTSDRVYPRYNSLKNTGRTSCTSPNIQQLPRSGGIRECFVPKPGHVFVDIDYTAIELAAIASICLRLFKSSKLAEVLNDDIDPHIYAASKIYKIPMEQLHKKSPERQPAKALNFGLVANMSPGTFRIQAKTAYNVDVTEEEAKTLKEEWAKIYPEIGKKYWQWGYGKNTVITHTGYVVSNCRYTQFLNYHMQSCVAQGAKLALYALMRSEWKVVAFVHDQMLIEVPEDQANRALEEASKIMIDCMQKVIVGVKVTTEGEIKQRFSK